MTRPICAVFIALTLAIIILAVVGTLRTKIKAIESEEEF
jgi:hypothetical protein